MRKANTLVLRGERGGLSLLQWMIALAMVVLFGYLMIMLGIKEEDHRILFIDLSVPAINLLATAGLFYGAYSSRHISRQIHTAWLVLACAQLAYTLGDITWSIIEVGLQVEAFPSIADVFYLAYYPLFFLGVLLLPYQRRSKLEWLKTTLDISIIMLVALLGFWNLLLGPIAISGMQDPILTQALTLAYPVGDLVLLWALLMLLYHQPKGQPQGPVFLLAGTTFAMILADCSFGFQSLQGTYVTGDLPDLGWVVSFLGAGLAGVWQAASIRSSYKLRWERASESADAEKTRSVFAHLPYWWLIAAYLLLIVSQKKSMPMGFATLAIGVGVVIGLVILRQVVTLVDNTNLSGQLKTLLNQVSRQANELKKANRELQIEIEERKRAEEQLAHDALHDSLTGLPNRALCTDRMQYSISHARRYPTFHFSVLFLDLDHFKVVNDSLGHTVGDKLLIAIAERLSGGVRGSDTVARLGGDEFVILMNDVENEGSAITAAKRIQGLLVEPFELEGHQVFASTSIGIVCNAGRYEQPEEILRDADIAMYHAKALGKARFEVFNPALRDRAVTRMELENQLHHALERDEFRLHYQPIVAINSKHTLGFEALLRWYHPVRGILQPDDFIPIAEETGLIVPIGQWVLQEACSQIVEWQNKFPQDPPLTMSVNISSRQLAQPGFAEFVEGTIRRTGLDGRNLHLEITENACLNKTNETVDLFNRLDRLGVQIELDDFGTGYSSLNYLQLLPISTIKIDREFINKMDHSEGNINFIRTILTLANDLGMKAIAEGVETEEQNKDLQKLGCIYAQGFFFCRPTDAQAIEQMLSHPH